MTSKDYHNINTAVKEIISDDSLTDNEKLIRIMGGPISELLNKIDDLQEKLEKEKAKRKSSSSSSWETPRRALSTGHDWGHVKTIGELEGW